ncbi:MAG: pyridoxamine 5'-phosphate oxidase [Cyclobacteriaceae bacterium]|nr:pyridoxamine 5'-phosphate oxidase [Cyclobacteriaceae bacterium HetDA_MAG_MS6]
MDIASLRKEYVQDELEIESTPTDPFELFQKWFQQASKADVLEPNAMILSTVSEAKKPTQRTVLLKAYDSNGFVFYTNYTSRKAKQIEGNNQVCLLFPWYALERQVTVTGRAQKVSKAQSLKYFTSRPKGSQLGAWVSHQSEVISTRSLLEAKLDEMKRKFKEGEIPLPDFWGGYRVIPDSIEFWQGRQNRLHDRIFYELADGNWNKSRLSP